MKTNDGEAKETGKENEAPKDNDNSKVVGEKDKITNLGESDKPTTNGVVENGVPEATQGDMTIETPTPKGKRKQREVEGGMISPESLEAT